MMKFVYISYQILSQQDIFCNNKLYFVDFIPTTNVALCVLKSCIQLHVSEISLAELNWLSRFS